ncbi:MAG TPA: YraN family protein [Anaerolineales bacterium]
MPAKIPTHNQSIARWGEDAAAQFILSLDCQIVARNTRTPYGEIDIVARRGDVTIFVEVKARTSATFGLPEEAVNARKLAHMLAAAEHYAAANGIDHWQIDVISVEGRPGSPPLITHFENVG